MKLIAMLLMISIMSQDSSSSIFDAKKVKDLSNWYVVDDGVMGGLSRGELTINDSGNCLFKGFVTTENNGGFSSIRYGFNKKSVSEFEHIILKLKGDGKSYQFRIKDNSRQRYSYIATFKTSGDWETIKIPLRSFYPGYRGYKLNKPNFSGEVMEEIGILIGNKVKESFALEIEKIYLE
ncbi:MAG: NADH dehydrogenase [ubiquinone] 1 alpha subcomplex assembly factor 1 [Flavobacteriaceae bacterium]|jgi:NADH dehydrogenase [ubiquinone] 1 alpha subcomplex assembly factor 1